jgi:D-aminopeptidase
MIVVALDAPVDARQLQRIAKRAILALGITGSSMSHGSGDYVVAFSTERIKDLTKDSLRLELGTRMRDEDLSPIFEAVVEATEEAIYNSLLKATTISGVDGHTVHALPIEKVKQVRRKYGRIK